MAKYYNPFWVIIFVLLTFEISSLPPLYLLDSLGDWVYQNPILVSMTYIGEVEMYPIRDNLAGLFAMPMVIFFILWRMKKRKIPLSELGSLEIQRKPLYLSIFLLAAFLIFEELYFYLLGIEMPESFIEFMLAEPILLGFISVVVVAPIIEEFLFRGFLYSQLRRSALKDWGAIAVSSLVWTAIHFQYEIGILFFLFLFGLFLGYLRLKYNSLLIPIALHAINNLLSFLQTIYFP
ncbi:MAG: CPBP family intramembrane metalloprotease [Gammaproteobacteria bacterium]|nr:MAG: CPBP family intramembrane metalloprotease [Gammaproteobacteria bacterium]